MALTRRRIIILGVLALIAAIALVWLVLFNRFVRVPTGSMANTILPGDSLVVDRLVGKIERGDIVIFKYPPDPSTQYCQRVIGLPGETIEIKGTRVYINYAELPEAKTFADGIDGGTPTKEISSEGDGRYRAFYIPTEDREFFDSMSAAPQEFGKGAPLFVISPAHYP